jgi:DNA-binding Lrp family transcriptional regulator
LGSRVVREPLVKLDRLDWKIIRQLRYDAKLETKEIANTLSTTPRMAGYRISKLLNSGAVSIRAVIDPRKQAGLVFYELEVASNEENHTRVIRSLRERFGEKLWYLTNPSPGVTVASLFSFTLGEPEESVKGTLRIEQVRRCSLFILKEVIEPRRLNWIDNLIESKISS